MQRTHILAGLGLAIAALFAPQFAEAQFDRGFQQDDLRGGQGQIILYSDTNFRGEARVYNGDVETLARDGFNDLARSVEIVGGAWTLCKDRGGEGRCRTIERSVADLGRLGLDCELTSFYQSGFSDAGFSGRRGDNGSFGRRSPRRFGGQDAPVRLFTKDDFGGRSVAVSGPVNLRDVGFNDKADSILISRGQWIVCTGRDLEGRCDVLANSVYDLDDIDLDDNISSIAPYNRRRRY